MIQFKFSDIRSNNLIGKSLRFPLSVLPKTSVFPIMQGPARGLKWVVGSGVHGIWLGSYEADKQQLLSKLPLKGTSALDIGANVGFFSILLSRMVGSSGKVIAFEPLPRNRDFIHKHIQLNKIENITVNSVAVGDTNQMMRFATSRYHEQGYLSEDGDLEVPVITLDSLSNFESPVSLVKIDVEGAEASVLKGGKSFFNSQRPKILLATHGKNQAEECKEILQSYSYTITRISKDLYGKYCDEWFAEPQGKLK